MILYHQQYNSLFSIIFITKYKIGKKGIYQTSQQTYLLFYFALDYHFVFISCNSSSCHQSDQWELNWFRIRISISLRASHCQMVTLRAVTIVFLSSSNHLHFHFILIYIFRANVVINQTQWDQICNERNRRKKRADFLIFKIADYVYPFQDHLQHVDKCTCVLYVYEYAVCITAGRAGFAI